MINPVLESTRFLVDSPEFVFINHEKLENVSSRFAKEGLPPPSWDMQIFPDSNDPNVIDFFMTASSINFHYPTEKETGKKYTIEYKGIPWTGAFGMQASIKRALDERISILDSDFLSDLSVEEAEHIFRGNMRIPMLEERVDILNDVGGTLNDLYKGSFRNLYEECKYRIFGEDGIVPRTTEEFIGFYDSVNYKNREITFNKKAQMAPALIYGKTEGSIPIPKEDIEKLTVFPDYQLPKVLRDLGIIEYEESLSRRVDNGIEIPKESREELEIRASTVHSSDVMINLINQSSGKEKINALHLDYKLFSNRNIPGGKPHHLTRTTAY